MKKAIATMMAMALAAGLVVTPVNAKEDAGNIDDVCQEVASRINLNADDYADLDEVTLLVTSSASSANLSFQVMGAVADAVIEATGGKLNFDIVWDGTLGNDNELTESCEAGDIDIVFESTSSLANYVPEAAVFDMPGLFTNVEEANAAGR